MSNQISKAFAEQFADNFKHLSQQTLSRLESAVTMEPKIKGASKIVSQLGLRTAKRRTARHSKTPLNNQPHSNRMLQLYDWVDNDITDDQDKIRTLSDPASDYTKAMVQSMNRAKDEEIIDALGGAAVSVAEIRQAGTSIPLPASQKIAHGGTGLTKDKIIQAKIMFRKNECDTQDGEEVYMIYHPKALTDILRDTQPTSADTIAVEAILTGSNKKWMGFEWIGSELLATNGGNRLVYAFAKSGMVLGIGENITARVAKDPSHSFSTRIYARVKLGAVRLEEKKVIEIAYRAS